MWKNVEMIEKWLEVTTGLKWCSLCSTSEHVVMGAAVSCPVSVSPATCRVKGKSVSQ